MTQWLFATQMWGSESESPEHMWMSGVSGDILITLALGRWKQGMPRTSSQPYQQALNSTEIPCSMNKVSSWGRIPTSALGLLMHSCTHTHVPAHMQVPVYTQRDHTHIHEGKEVGQQSESEHRPVLELNQAGWVTSGKFKLCSISCKMEMMLMTVSGLTSNSSYGDRAN